MIGGGGLIWLGGTLYATVGGWVGGAGVCFDALTAMEGEPVMMSE